MAILSHLKQYVLRHGNTMQTCKHAKLRVSLRLRHRLRQLVNAYSQLGPLPLAMGMPMASFMVYAP